MLTNICQKNVWIVDKEAAELVKRLTPKTIIVYGAAPDDVFGKYAERGIEILPFESEFSKSRKQVVA